MRTGKLSQLTEKSQGILELIEKVNERLESSRHWISLFINDPDPFHPIKLFNSLDDLYKKENDLNRVKLRLVKYYSNTLTEIIVHSLTQGAFNFNDVELALVKRQNYALN